MVEAQRYHRLVSKHSAPSTLKACLRMTITSWIRRLLLLIGCLGCLILFVISIQWNLPWLVAENQRLEPWKLPIIWLSEATGLVLFLLYMVSLLLPDRLRSKLHHKLTIRVFM